MGIACCDDRVGEDCVRRQRLVLQGHGERRQQVLVLLLVLVDGREVQVHHLHHGLQVLGSRVSGHILTGIAHRQVSVHLLACQCLLQLRAGETAQATVADGLVEHFQVGIVRLAIQRLAAFGEGLHLHLVILEVGFLQQHGSSVRQRQLRKAQQLVLFLLFDGTGLDLGHVHQRLGFHIVHIGGNLRRAGGSHGSSHVLLGGIYLAVQLLCPFHHHQVAV